MSANAPEAFALAGEDAAPTDADKRMLIAIQNYVAWVNAKKECEASARIARETAQRTLL